MRHDEIPSTKNDQQLNFDVQGNVKVTKAENQLNCDVTGELRLRQCLTRKALAFDQIKLCSFDVMETWHNAVVQALMRKPPAGHKYVTIQQIMAADRELWSLLSQNTRGKLKVMVGQPPPLDDELETLRRSPPVLCFMTPLPGQTPKVETPKTPLQAAPKPGLPNTPQQHSKTASGTKRKFEGSGTTVKELLQKLATKQVYLLVLQQWHVQATEGGIMQQGIAYLLLQRLWQKAAVHRVWPLT